MYKIISVDVISEDFLKFVRNLRDIHMTETGITDRDKGRMISVIGTSCILYWNKNNIGRNENKIGWKIILSFINLKKFSKLNSYHV